MAAILPTLRVNAHSHPSVGSHTATQDGVYEIVFDNSYSRYIKKREISYIAAMWLTRVLFSYMSKASL